jgi:hypothetical protein
MTANNFTCLTGDSPVNLTSGFQCNAGFFCKPTRKHLHIPQFDRSRPKQWRGTPTSVLSAHQAMPREAATYDQEHMR